MKRDSAINVARDRFFHLSISGLEAEELLQNEPNGTFLVRESTSLPGEYALSVKNDDNILHVRIYHDGEYRIVPKDNFATLAALIDHYVQRPMIQYCGNAVRLKQPLMSTRFTAACVDERIDCLVKVPKKANVRDGIAEEFERLHNSKGPHLFMSCKEGRKTENVLKNRYRNIIPYDHTRVRLNLQSNGSSEPNDYINASFVDVLCDGVLYSEFEGINKRYISTQGCLQNTVDDFWQMVWQENSRIIVMTTKEMERGRLKCCKYWPDFQGDDQICGMNREFRLRTIKEENIGEYIVRSFELHHTPKESMENGESTMREIYHYQFLGWEDQSCPSGLLLNYLEEINTCAETKCPADSGRVIVHCSAGIGRTGTFIVLDIILAKIKLHGSNCPIDIFKTVRMVREQRATMVQTEAQYRFIYEAISSYIKAFRNGSSSSSSTRNYSGHQQINGRIDNDENY